MPEEADAAARKRRHAAARARRYRQRQLASENVVAITLTDGVVARLIDHGFIAEDRCDDRAALADVIRRLVENAVTRDFQSE